MSSSNSDYSEDYDEDYEYSEVKVDLCYECCSSLCIWTFLRIAGSFCSQAPTTAVGLQAQLQEPSHGPGLLNQAILRAIMKDWYTKAAPLWQLLASVTCRRLPSGAEGAATSVGRT